jgi:hypothetical protein
MPSLYIPSAEKRFALPPRLAKAKRLQALFEKAAEDQTNGALIDAMKGYHAILSIEPKLAGVYVNMACIYCTMREWDKAVSWFKKAISLAPTAIATYGLAKTYCNMGPEHAGDAMLAYAAALEADPTFAAAIFGMAQQWRQHGQMDFWSEAIKVALSLPCKNSADEYERSFVEMSFGLPEGPIRYQQRWHNPGFSSLNFRGAFMTAENWWNGDAFDGTLLFHREQGNGDTFLCLRYVRPFAKIVKQLVVTVSADMLPFVRHSFADLTNVIVVDDALPDTWPKWDKQLPGFDAMALDSNKYADTVPYLHSATTTEFSSDKGQRAVECPCRHIGIVWQGRRDYVHDRQRSVSLSALEPLFTIPGITWHALAVDAEALIDADAYPQLVKHDIKSFVDTAALVCGCDAVVSVDTSVAHLAAALGKPLHLLLPDVCAWLWGMAGGESVWYPTAHLYRQAYTPEHDWSVVVAQVRDALSVGG